VVGESICFGVVSIFSCEEGGSSASLLGTGVDSFLWLAILALGSKEEADLGFCCFALGGIALAFVVSLRAGEDAEEGETCDCCRGAGEEDGAGEDFWKKETMERCLTDEVAVLPVAALAGVRAAVLPAARSSAIVLFGKSRSMGASTAGWESTVTRK
jgi:hypothetical protein